MKVFSFLAGLSLLSAGFFPWLSIGDKDKFEVTASLIHEYLPAYCAIGGVALLVASFFSFDAAEQIIGTVTIASFGFTVYYAIELKNLYDSLSSFGGLFGVDVSEYGSEISTLISQYIHLNIGIVGWILSMLFGFVATRSN